MSEFRQKVEQIESAVDLARDILSTGNPFSFALESAMGVGAAERADTWISMNKATDPLNELLFKRSINDPEYQDERRDTPKRDRIRKIEEQRQEIREFNEMDREQRPEKLARLKDYLDDGLKSLRSDIGPRVLHADQSEWDKIEREKEIAERVDAAMADIRKNMRMVDEVRESDRFPALKMYLDEHRPASMEEWRRLVRDIVDVEAPVRRQYEQLESELAGACRICDELIAATARVKKSGGEQAEGHGGAGGGPG